MDLGDRIRSLREETGLSAAALARELGVTRSAVGQWEGGSTSPSLENLSALAVIGDVNFEWLATGRGPRRHGAVREGRRSYSEAAVARDREERKLLLRFRDLPARRRKALLDMLDD